MTVLFDASPLLGQWLSSSLSLTVRAMICANHSFREWDQMPQGKGLGDKVIGPMQSHGSE